MRNSDAADSTPSLGDKVIATIQPLLVFALGVAGNKVAEITSLSRPVIISVTVLLLVAISLGARYLPGGHNLVRLSRRNTRSAGPVTFLTIGLISGLLAAMLSVPLMPPSRTIWEIPFSYGKYDYLWIGWFNSYEVIGAFAGILICLVVALLWSMRQALALTLGYALALAAAYTVSNPRTNYPLDTFLGHLGVAFIGWTLIVPITLFLSKRRRVPKRQQTAPRKR